VSAVLQRQGAHLRVEQALFVPRPARHGIMIPQSSIALLNENPPRISAGGFFEACHFEQSSMFHWTGQAILRSVS
jgi:hypothetical protein